MHPIPKIITVTLNPCMDKTVEIAGFGIEKTNRVLQSRTDIGGKGVNVARVLANCGEDFVAAGLVAGLYGASWWTVWKAWAFSPPFARRRVRRGST